MNCKNCGNGNVIRHGTRKTKKGSTQIFLCRDCNRVFSNNVIPYMNTRAELILRGITLYNQGYSLGQCSKMLETSFNKRIPRNTLHYWTKQYKDTFPYLNIREKKGSRIPLLPKVYGSTTFSLHRRKANLLPGRMEPLKNYISRALKGLDPERLGKEPLDGVSCNRCTDLMDNREISIDNPESRILRLSLESNETDPIRHILINDSLSICRNLPVYLNRDRRDHSGFIDLVQDRDNRVCLLLKRIEEIDSETTMRYLIGSGIALLQRTKIPPGSIRLGAFDTVKMWTLDFEYALKKLRLTPKTN